jgi:heat shock protein beta
MKITLAIIALLTISLVHAQDEPAAPKKETHVFEAEVSRLLDIIINSLYSNKDIFLREAISNANDALDKLRFLSLEDSNLMKDDEELRVNMEIDKDSNMLVITDTGIGMTVQELRNNLGTIARSGTTQFLEAITKTGNLNLIGQFGVGFYSYFLIANKVRVITKSPNSDVQYIWESEAGSTYSIEVDTEGPFLKRGTRVELLLKKDAKEYLETKKVTDLAKKYSEFIEFPIYMYASKQISKQVEEEVEEENQESQDDMEIKDSTEESEKKTKTITETVWDWERVNNEKAIWKRSMDEITDPEYVNFYKTTTKDYSDPLTWIHFKAEGEIDFTSLLYIPRKVPSSMTKRPDEEDKSSNLKLYVRKVLISDKFNDLLPAYLGFVRGVVDSDDLPLNVSRETLQQYRSVKLIKKKLTRKVIDQLIKFSTNKLVESLSEAELESMTEEERSDALKQQEDKKKENTKLYSDFYDEFSRFIKQGTIEDTKNRDKLASLLRFPSTLTSELKATSLDDYISRMPEEQKEIFFIAGEDKQKLSKHPQVKSLVKKGYEVFLMEEAFDEYCMQNLVTYNDVTISNVTKAGFTPPKNENEESQIERMKDFYKPLTDWISKVLSSNIEKVELTLNTDNNPLLVLAGTYGYTANMQKLAMSQPMANKKQTEQMLSQMKNVIHINPTHPIIKEMLDRVKQSDPSNVDKDLENNLKLLYQVATIQSGFTLSRPEDFVSSFQSMLKDSLGLDRSSNTVDLEGELTEFEQLEAARKEAEKAEQERIEKLKEEEAQAAKDAEMTQEENGDDVKVEDVDPATEGEFQGDSDL